MEHPDVIREIDALIDSYNWEGMSDKPSGINIPVTMKQALRSNYTDEYWRLQTWMRRFPLRTFILLQLSVKILEYPRLVNKEWAFLLVAFMRLHPINHINSRKIQQLLHQSIPLFVRFLHHRKAIYRVCASHTLAHLEYQSDKVANLLLARLYLERSPKVISLIINDLISLLKRRRGITPETKQAILSYAEARLKAKNPLIAIPAATLALPIVRKNGFANVIEKLYISWPHMADGFERVIGDEFLLAVRRYPRLDITKQLLYLLSKSRYHSTVVQILQAVLNLPNHYPYQRWITITSQQKFVLESAIVSRALWNKSSEYWSKGDYGLEPTRAALRQQLSHARIIDETEQASEFSSEINLISYSTIPQ